MNESWVKYPRTLHLPNSPGVNSDDKVLSDLSCLEGKAFSLSVKMDGENTTMYRDGLHARSLDSRHHPSRNWVKNLWAQVAHKIPLGWRICGENLYAVHSIAYKDLESYFQVFSVWDDQNVCLSVEETRHICAYLGLTMIDDYADTPVGDSPKDILKWATHFAEKHVREWGEEGIVIRNAGRFHYNTFQENVFKYVREGHVQTDEHWRHQKIVPNQLREGK